MIKKPYFSFSNISTAILIAFSLLMVFSPDAKALVLRGLMQIGLFQPDVGVGKTNAQILPDFSFRDSTGKAVSLSSLRGKVVFINFWATWCPPCRAEMPAINELYNVMKHNDKIEFLMVDVDNDYTKARNYINKEHLNLPVLTPVGEIPESLLGGPIPTTLILNTKGELVFKHEGASDFSGKKVHDYLTALSRE
ncbi:MAG: TlpA family protein disulfide reductase [Sphingobacteriaceae bacterium]|jgi:thiol-disulfide isomerase/thioredoxin|nr:TlpA family protein disulfide reductase [Sphingobacteriaceae bacterium]